MGSTGCGGVSEGQQGVMGSVRVNGRGGVGEGRRGVEGSVGSTG